MKQVLTKVNIILHHPLASVCASAILPLLFIFIWLICNTQLPGNDASNYLMTIVDIYQYTNKHGLLSGIFHSFFDRGWRPIAYPNLSVPFILITSGNLYATYFLTAVSCMLVSVLYIYLYFRLTLSNTSSIIAANLVGLLPLIQAQNIMFYAEGALFFCILGSLYHLIKSDYFRNKFHSIAFVVLFSLAVLIRPVEAVTQLIFVMIAFIVDGFLKRKFNSRQLSTVFCFMFVAISLFFYSALLPSLQLSPAHLVDNGGVLDTKMTHILKICFLVSFLCAFVVSVVVLYRNKNIFWSNYNEWLNSANKSYLVPAIISSILIILLWYLPFSYETYQWIYRTSLGDVASSTGALSGSQFSWDVLYKYLVAEGILIVSVALLLAVVGVFSISRANLKEFLISKPFVYLLLTLPFPVWESLYTVQIVTRKLAFAFPALIMAQLMLGMQNGRGLFQRNLTLLLLLICQFITLTFLVYFSEYSRSSAFVEKTVGFFIPAPVTIKPEPHSVVDIFLLDQYKLNHFKSVGLEVNPGTPDARHFIEAEPIDPFLLSTLAVANQRPYSAGYPYMSVDSHDSVTLLKQRHDAILLSDREDRMMVTKVASDNYSNLYSNERSPSLRLFYRLLLLYSQGDLKRAGFKVSQCIIVRSKSQTNYKVCLLLPNNA